MQIRFTSPCEGSKDYFVLGCKKKQAPTPHFSRYSLTKNQQVFIKIANTFKTHLKFASKFLEKYNSMQPK
jgi:hypothetical protein